MALSTATFDTLGTKFLNDTFADFAKSIRIVELLRTADGQGGNTTSRVLFSSNVCFIFPMVGQENIEAGGLYTDQDFKFSMKPITDLTNKMIIEYDSFDYKIESVEDVVEAGVWINVIAKKGDPCA